MITCNTYSTHFLDDKRFYPDQSSTNISFRFSFCQKHSDSDTNLYSEKHQAQGEAIAQSGSIYADVSQAWLKHFPFKTWHASPSGKVKLSHHKNIEYIFSAAHRDRGILVRLVMCVMVGHRKLKIEIIKRLAILF